MHLVLAAPGLLPARESATQHAQALIGIKTAFELTVPQQLRQRVRLVRLGARPRDPGVIRADRVAVALLAYHDHVHRPFVWLTPNEADLRRTTLTQGESHASIKSRRRASGGDGDTSFVGQAKQSTHVSRVSPPPARDQPDGSDVTTQTTEDSDSEISLALPCPGTYPQTARSTVDDCGARSETCGTRWWAYPQSVTRAAMKSPSRR